ncbi:hypothetical protein BT96DRAFT_946052 [Gymnopus androsaceus JB14]|uniref:Uncharacterized protein n=1 Tax=Gymnopus androsaceus JB14 TaxID=1447944 RepID=A0A6A4GZG8_9AGAR|nr:hypothetical protein BT96DRAFT_946052 [Gymnopus androsaceus JB14]
MSEIVIVPTLKVSEEDNFIEFWKKSQQLQRKWYSLEKEQVSALIQESCMATDSQVEEATEVGVEVTATVEETPVLGEEETELEEETDTELLLLELELAQSQVLSNEKKTKR